MKKNGLSVFKMERENFKITLKTAEAGKMVAATYQAPPQSPPSAPPPATIPEPPASDLKEIKSPMVGTFYSSPAPDAPPFAEPGKTVAPDSVVCIIEAMKVMNEIKAEVGGTIVDVCAENGKPVQFGEVLFRVK